MADARNPVYRALRVLQLIAVDPDREWGVREIASVLNGSPSGVHRTLGTLRRQGLVSVNARTSRYRPSLELYRLAWLAVARFPFTRVALPEMQALVATCEETAFLGLYDPARMEMMFVACVESPHPLRYVVRLHEWLPLYAGAAGLGIMAFLPDSERRLIVERTRLKAVTERTITNRAQLEEQVKKIRRQGYACTRGQRVPGAVGIAAPIWGVADRVIGDLLLTIPEQRFRAGHERELAPLVKDCARRITKQCGGQLPDDALQTQKPRGRAEWRVRPTRSGLREE